MVNPFLVILALLTFFTCLTKCCNILCKVSFLKRIFQSCYIKILFLIALRDWDWIYFVDLLASYLIVKAASICLNVLKVFLFMGRMMLDKCLVNLIILFTSLSFLKVITFNLVLLNFRCIFIIFYMHSTL